MTQPLTFTRISVALACLAVAAPALAQTTGTGGATGTSTLAASDIFIALQHEQGSNLSSFDLPKFFNKANCDCDATVFVYAALTQTGVSKRATVPAGTIEFWSGTQCDNRSFRRCKLLKSEPLQTFMALGRDTIQTTARVLSTFPGTTDVDGGVTTGPTDDLQPTTTCTTPGVDSFQPSVWALVDIGSDGTYDVNPPSATGLRVDLTPPPTPSGVVVAPGNEALNVSWTAVDSSLYQDLLGYQVLCRRGADLQVFPDNTFTPVFLTNVCANPMNGVGIEGLNPMFACSPQLNRSATSYRVKILQNGITYAAAVVAVDNSGNAMPPVLLSPDNYGVPAKTNSFYEVYRNGGGGPGQGPTPGQAAGGYCAVATGGHEGTALGMLTVLGAMALIRGRRRRAP